MSTKITNHSHSAAKSGFTIIELSLSIAFIAILSIAVTLIIVNSIASYRRGITLNQLNTTGMDLVDDMRTSVQDSSISSIIDICSKIYPEGTPAREKCENDRAHNFITVVRNADVSVGGKSIGNVPVFGALCTGNYSYIWNSGYFFSSDYSVSEATIATLKYKFAGSNVAEEEKEPFKLLKVKDESRSVCISAVLGDSSTPKYETDDLINGGKSEFDISGEQYDALETSPVDLLNKNGNMAIYNLSSTTPASGAVAKKLFYNVSFILGTIQGGINIGAQGGYCATPEGYNSAVENFDYCAINKFNFAAQTTGG